MNRAKLLNNSLIIAKLTKSIPIYKNILNLTLSISKIVSSILSFINFPSKDKLISLDFLSRKLRKGYIKIIKNNSSKEIKIRKYWSGWISKIIKDSLRYYMLVSAGILMLLGILLKNGESMIISRIAQDSILFISLLRRTSF
mgnify:CR=1 FL=1